MWYFPALIAGLWITYFLVNKLKKKTTFLIVSILYLIGLFGDSYYGIAQTSGIITNIYNVIFKVCDYTRNGLFLVPIFIYLGYVVKTNKVNKSADLYISLCCFICMTIEGMVLHHLNYQRHDSMYIFLVPVMFFLFRYLMSKNSTSNKKLREISTGIYIFHPLFIVAIRFVSGIVGLEKIFVENNLILYLTVCLGTFLFTLLIQRGKGLFKNVK